MFCPHGHQVSVLQCCAGLIRLAPLTGRCVVARRLIAGHTDKTSLRGEKFPVISFPPHPSLLPTGEGTYTLSYWERVGVRADLSRHFRLISIQ
jgi:hypothetical protein